jgi:hypothetical protein
MISDVLRIIHVVSGFVRLGILGQIISFDFTFGQVISACDMLVQVTSG